MVAALLLIPMIKHITKAAHERKCLFGVTVQKVRVHGGGAKNS